MDGATGVRTWPISGVGCNLPTGYCTVINCESSVIHQNQNCQLHQQTTLLSPSLSLAITTNMACIISVLILTHPDSYLPDPCSYLPVLSKVASLSIKKTASRTFRDINPWVPRNFPGHQPLGTSDLAAPYCTNLNCYEPFYPGSEGPRPVCQPGIKKVYPA